jgi:mRNA interferase YafQ
MKSINYTSQFKRDLKKAKKQGRDIGALQSIIKLLYSESVLPAKFKDHRLVGNYKGRRECHVAPDFLLIYLTEKEELTLERLGSHSDLFK